jgi:hypothetical protein
MSASGRDLIVVPLTPRSGQGMTGRPPLPRLSDWCLWVRRPLRTHPGAAALRRRTNPLAREGSTRRGRRDFDEVKRSSA